MIKHDFNSHFESEKSPTELMRDFFLFKHKVFLELEGFSFILSHFYLDMVAYPELFLSLSFPNLCLSLQQVSDLVLFLSPLRLPACNVLLSVERESQTHFASV